MHVTLLVGPLSHPTPLSLSLCMCVCVVSHREGERDRGPAAVFCAPWGPNRHREDQDLQTNSFLAIASYISQVVHSKQERA